MKGSSGSKRGQSPTKIVHSPAQKLDKPVQFVLAGQNSLHAQPDSGGETISQRGVGFLLFQHEALKPRANSVGTC